MVEEVFYSVLKDDRTVSRLYDHMTIFASPKYLPQFVGFVKATNVAKPLYCVWESILTVVRRFVASAKAAAGKTSIVLDKVILVEEDRLFTAVSCLVRASENPDLLDREGYDLHKETHLQKGRHRGLRRHVPAREEGSGDGKPAAGSGRLGAERAARPFGRACGRARGDARRTGQAFPVRPRYVFATRTLLATILKLTDAHGAAPNSRSCCASFCCRCASAATQRRP